MNLDKFVGLEPLVLSEGDFDEMGETFWHITKHMWGNIEDQYKNILIEVHNGLKEL